MKVKTADAHDRLLHFNQQSDMISRGCQDCINNRPDEFTMPFYIFAHCRTIEIDERVSIFNQDFYESIINPTYKKIYNSLEDVPTGRLIWSPRLTKPKAQENSMLFKAYPGSDNVKVIWIIPAKELWDQYKKDNITESRLIWESIEAFKHRRKELEEVEEGDLSDEEANVVYSQIKKNKKKYKFEMIK